MYPANVTQAFPLPDSINPASRGPRDALAGLVPPTTHGWGWVGQGACMQRPGQSSELEVGGVKQEGQALIDALAGLVP